MSLIVGVERGFVNRSESGFCKLTTAMNFLEVLIDHRKDGPIG
jgi:hypothetical protein